MNVAVVPAAGAGKRMGLEVPKQFLSLGGAPVLARTLARLQDSPVINEIVVAAPVEYHATVQAIAQAHGIGKLAHIARGGEQRQQSVWNALQAANPAAEIVVIHDAVRPFVTAAQIHAVVAAAQRHGAAILAVRVKDTIKVADEHEFVINTLDRDYLWSVQTPQAFRREVVYQALQKAEKEHFTSTDEASVVEYYGGDVKIVEGRDDNFKITTQTDLKFAESLLNQ
jgi:2-C-methyl-D-erythritol 4-phosphate cytidylyltransferase